MRALNRRDFILKAASAGGAALMAGGAAGMVASADLEVLSDEDQVAEMGRLIAGMSERQKRRLLVHLSILQNKSYSHRENDPEIIAEGILDANETRRVWTLADRRRGKAVRS